MPVLGQAFDPAEWTMLKSVRNPWGEIPVTDGGRSIHGRARTFMDRLLAQRDAPDPVSRRHHYVPQTYLRKWSSDGTRIWTLDTVTGVVRQLGLRDVCVKENFYRVAGPDGVPHNRVELLFGVVDSELHRLQCLLDELEDPEVLEFDDLISLGVCVAVQRMRTLQERRLRLQHNAWLSAQNPDQFVSIEDNAENPNRLAGIHTQVLFSGMWEAADVLTTRQIEIWQDDAGRFWTCDAPVLLPFVRNVRRSLLSASYVIWPISPHRAIALGNDPQGEKAVIRRATGQLVGITRRAVEQGHERMIFASEQQATNLPSGKKFRRRPQVHLRCSSHYPSGELVRPPGCCVAIGVSYGAEPDIALCRRGHHRPAPTMLRHL